MRVVEREIDTAQIGIFALHKNAFVRLRKSENSIVLPGTIGRADVPAKGAP